MNHHDGIVPEPRWNGTEQSIDLPLSAANLLEIQRIPDSPTRARVGVSFRAVDLFVAPLSPEWRLYAYFPIGLTVFGVFGSFTYYLPELFPTRLRGTGAGFCYNVGRVIAAGGPFLVGIVASRGAVALTTAMDLLFWVGLVPLVGVLLLPIVVETKDRALA